MSTIQDYANALARLCGEVEDVINGMEPISRLEDPVADARKLLYKHANESEPDAKYYSTGEAAKKLGITRDNLLMALRRGAPDAVKRVGTRRMFLDSEIQAIQSWRNRSGARTRGRNS